MSFRKLYCTKGVSLLEVLVSMLVLSFGVLGLDPMLVLSIEGNVISQDNSVVSTMLKEKIEFYENVDTLPTLPYRELEEGIDSRFARTTIIQDSTTDASIPYGVCQCDVQVTWVDHQNVRRSSSYSSFILTI